jgi:hypothetical protein
MKRANHFTARRRLGHGASWRVRFKIADCAIVTTTAIVLTAVSLVLATPASAADPHGTNDPANQTATSASQQRDESVGSSSQRSRPHSVETAGKVAPDPSVGEPATAAEPVTADPEASEAWLPGHDKCKRRRGLRPLPLWCTDPAAGWIRSTTDRAENNPGNPIGICDTSSLHPASRCRPVRTAAAVTSSLRRRDPGQASGIVQRSMISGSAVWRATAG